MNSNLTWIIENFDQSTGYIELSEEVIRQGYNCELVTLDDVKDIDNKLSLLPAEYDGAILVQASFEFSDKVLNKYSYRPARFLNIENYEYNKYAPYFSDYLFNSDYSLSTVNFVEFGIDSLVNLIGEKESGRVFIRPNTGRKSFTGMVFINKDPYFEYDWSHVKKNTQPTDLVIVSSPKAVKFEYRFVVVDGEVITGSLYRLDYDTEFKVVPKNVELFKFAQRMADRYQPDRVYTLDVVIDSEGTMKLLEINSFSCAGLYACDMEIIADRVSKVALDIFKQNKAAPV
jgi:hypothetical protein